jgi:DNA-binding PucR family transcriptional regulator
VGISPQVTAIEAPEAWRKARIAIRFATTSARYEDLGAQALLADLPAEEIAKQPDVRALDQLAADPQMLALLNAVATTSSIRQAATTIHRHHSSLPARLEHAQQTLGFPLDTQDGRFRLRLALVLRQLRDSA